MKKLLLLLLVPFMLFSQKDEGSRTRYGLYFGYGLNSHSADFKRLPDCPSCSPGYKEGKGTGLNFGLVFDYPLSRSFYLSGKLLYLDLSGKLVSTESTVIIADGKPTPGEFEHTLESRLGVIGFQPSIMLNLINNLNLSIGFNISYLLKKEYAQVERITKPTDYGTFLNPDGTDSYSRERNKFSGTLKEANTSYLAPVASISYTVPFDKHGKFLLEPAITYHHGISNIVSDVLVKRWTVSSLSFGISLKYSPLKPKPKKEIKIEEYKIDTITIEKDIIASSHTKGKEFYQVETIENETEVMNKTIITRTDTIFIPKMYKIDGKLIAVGVDSTGNEIPNPEFVIEEFISNRLDPLLNYIFFENNSSTIPMRYIQLSPDEARDFNVNNLFRDSTLQLYHNILNIIGKRLTENPTATITLVGCNSDLGTEKENLKLSELRANTVKNYLVNTWNIEPERIKIKSRNLPEKPSTPITEPDKIMENRRVEIYSDNPKILEPIFIEKIDRNATPPKARFKLQATSDLPLSGWELRAYQESKPDVSFIKKGGNTLTNQIDWELSTDQTIIPQYEEPLKSELILEDVRGNRKTIKGNNLTIKVKTIQEKRRKMLGDYEIERYSLILFDFDKSTIEGRNKQIVEFIKTRIKENSEIIIAGYADRTGDPEHNIKLSESRALETRNKINQPAAIAYGYGSSRLLYNNELPEGRFYCRTVIITVKTKVR